MKLGALRFRLMGSDRDSLDVHAWTGSALDLSRVGEPTVFVVPAGALQAMREQPKVFIDRGTKHPARPLAALLLRQPGVPLVSTTYASARQLPRSIKDFLEKAAVSGEHKAFVLGVPDRVYQESAARTGTRAGAVHDGDAGDDVEDLVDDVDVPPSLMDAVVGASAQMDLVREWIVRAARHVEPVLILGETGTGKGVVAKAIHDVQFGNLKPFQPVNCGAIPTELFESEFFGYVPGAFSNGLKSGSPGVWRRADGGTLFLDELGELMPLHQTKLLRAIESNVVRPVGSTAEISVKARIVSATNRDLRLMIESGEFREDLYYRVGVTVITMPRLRDRPDDIAPLAETFWSTLAPKRPPLSQETTGSLTG